MVTFELVSNNIAQFSSTYSQWPYGLSKALLSSIPSFSCPSDLFLPLVLNKASWRIIRSAKCSKATNLEVLESEQTAAAPVIYSQRGDCGPHPHKPQTFGPLCVFDAVWRLDLWKCCEYDRIYYYNYFIMTKVKGKSQKSHSKWCFTILWQQILWQALKAAMRSHNKTLILHLHISSSYQSLSVAWGWWEEKNI